MRTIPVRLLLPTLAVITAIVACNFPSLPQAPTNRSTETPNPSNQTTSIAPPPASPAPTRLLTICMGSEPQSLFLYADNSLAARGIRQAIYDGPIDVVSYEHAPVIIDQIPNLSNGGVRIEPISIEPGMIIVDALGSLVILSEGVLYRPAGCRDDTCTMTYSGDEPVQMDQMVVQYKLRPGILWSDGAPLSADDSVFSYEVASSLYPRARAELIDHTQSYRALDETTVEWRGVPGYKDTGYASNFFHPLPRHTWGQLTADELLTAESINRSPLGWGPYQIDEWTQGDHISLSRNPTYFRSAEGLPHFEKLVFRFVQGEEAAVEALLAGECDYLDETISLEKRGPELLQLQGEGKLMLFVESGSGWEHADFGILPWGPQQEGEGNPTYSLFQFREVRQGIATCIDRERMAQEIFFVPTIVPDVYLSPSHPLTNPDAKRYEFDPGAAAALFEGAGWIDEDGNPDTPRIARGVNGVSDGTPMEFTFLTTTEEEKLRAAQILQESLAECGVKVNVETLPWEELYSPGPDGPIFGRSFSMAQFGWRTTLQPPCFLYTTDEIPGPYLDFPKGWGGANASGYSNPEFDLACAQALSSLLGTPEHQSAHFRAQEIFAEDLPAIPLYLRLKLSAARVDMCGVQLDAHPESSLWNLESFDYGVGCEN